jgi:biotin carboxyl carrier protein
MTTPRCHPDFDGVTVVRAIAIPYAARREPDAAETTRWARLDDDSDDVATTTAITARTAAAVAAATGAGAALALVTSPPPRPPPPPPAPRPRAPTAPPPAPRPRAPTAPPPRDEALGLRRLASAARRIALQRTADDVGRAAAALAPAVVDGVRATFLFVDATRGALWAPGSDEEHALVGLAGAAVTANRPLILERAGDDPRHAPAIDDPHSTGGERLAAMPIADADAEIHAVLIVVRAPAAPPFDDADRDLLAALAARIATVIDAFALEARADQLAPPPTSPFRAEATAAHAHRKDEGAVLRLTPRWSRFAYWLLVGFATAAVSYLCLARIDDHAEGPAVVVSEGRTPVTLRTAATVRAVRVAPGDRVRAGQPLAHLDDAAQRADLAATSAELERGLIDRLEHPDDQAAGATLAGLVARRDRAQAALDERTLRAPITGVVADVRIRPGQAALAGHEALAIVDGNPRVGIVALVPAGLAPQIRIGSPLRLSLAGHPGTFETLTVTSVASDATGPSAAAQLLGAELGDAVPLGGALVAVRARAERPDFAAGRVRLPYRHGMAGRAAIAIRSQRLITALVPGLEEVFAP